MNLGLLLDMAADGFGDRVIIGRRGNGLTTAKLREMSAVGAQTIRESGADAVVYLAVNGPAFPVALFSAARAGVPLVPVNYRLGQEQMEGLLANHPKAFGIAGTTGEAAALHAAGLTTRTPEEWLEQCAAGSAQDEGFVDPESPAVIIYTSGSTSAPKGVVLRHQNLFSYVTGSVEFAGAGEDEAALISVPPYHIAAVANCISNLYAGRRTMVLEQFVPDQWLELVREEGVTNALVVPTMLKRVLEATGDLSVPTLKTLAYGGGPMPAPVIENALHAWPNVGFVNAYGLTETSSTVAVLGPDDHRAAIASDEPAVRARLGSVGQPLPAIQIQIRDEDGNPVPAGVKGRIFVSGAQVSAEYLGQGSVVDATGFFDTRDEGYVDEQGYLFIGGRADDTIIRGAENIAPAEIEDVLLRHPAVADAVVVGVPSVEWGQTIEAVIVLADGQSIDEQAVRDYARGALRGSRTPDHVTFWGEIPRTETGKLIRRNIVAALADELPKS
ncbi:MAG TPA: class I adenylate-forming enzyme family protein [Jatrophihabitans sp.]|jgi:acyl-CoA synthetase (AMP-forming)/AMP-acid ligase II